ncbi:MAG TPA: right-handed parallel beta-helix repeat-containing protein [Candidatus Binatia bacterium]|jgi:parallel beta-helix repeat protein|nr:right-handed parallel beta-helix repeat-containing protein [Candidatus Binatia bacterium]
MKPNLRHLFASIRPALTLSAGLLLSIFNQPRSTAFAQGSLTPPGPPGPTMKTLTQIEPRTPISSLPYTIASAGAYYLTTNLTGVSGSNGITIAANDVILDLKGFSLVGGPGSFTGILVSGNRTNLWIGSGTIRGWGQEGIDGTTAQSSVFADLKIIGSGDVGLRSGTAAQVTRCTAIGNSQEGILTFDGCVISQCAAGNNGASGIYAGGNSRITDCPVRFNGYNGITASSGCSISGCTSANNNNSGISTDTGGSISHCTAAANLVRGIDVGAASSVTHCTVLGTGNYGSTELLYFGIIAGDGSVVANCTIRNYDGVPGGATSTSGIFVKNNCTVNGCSASANRIGVFTGSNCVVTACSAGGNASYGIYLGAYSTAKACAVSTNGFQGIDAYGGYSTVDGCTASGNKNSGIALDGDGNVVLNNTCDGNGTGLTLQAGILCFIGSRERIEGNHFSNNNLRGLYVDSSSTHNIITRNIAITNSIQTIGYDVNTANNDVGPIGRAATATSPWANLQY